MLDIANVKLTLQKLLVFYPRRFLLSGLRLQEAINYLVNEKKLKAFNTYTCSNGESLYSF